MSIIHKEGEGTYMDVTDTNKLKTFVYCAGRTWKSEDSEEQPQGKVSKSHYTVSGVWSGIQKQL